MLKHGINRLVPLMCALNLLEQFMNTNRQWLLAKRPHGMVGEENFEYAETPIPEAGDGEVVVRNLFLSFDPIIGFINS